MWLESLSLQKTETTVENAVARKSLGFIRREWCIRRWRPSPNHPYPLVNIQKTMERSTMLLMVNPLLSLFRLGHFLCRYVGLPEGIIHDWKHPTGINPGAFERRGTAIDITSSWIFESTVLFLIVGNLEGLWHRVWAHWALDLKYLQISWKMQRYNRWLGTPLLPLIYPFR